MMFVSILYFSICSIDASNRLNTFQRTTPSEEGNEADQPNGYQTGTNPDIDISKQQLYVKYAHLEKLSSGAITYEKDDDNKKMLI